MGWVSSNFFNNLRSLEISRSLLIFVTFKASIPKAQLILYFSVNDPLPMCGRAVVPRYGGGGCVSGPWSLDWSVFYTDPLRVPRHSNARAVFN